MPSSTSSSRPSTASPLRLSSRRALRIARDGAKRVLERRFRVLLLIRDAHAHMTDHAPSVQGVRTDLAAFLRLLKAWALRQYRHIPWTALLLIAGAVVYFVMPADLIPDMLAGIGFVDDVAVVSAAVRSVQEELDRFRAWEQNDPSPLPLPAHEASS